MLNFSQIIKNERINQKLTQQSLAKGICSTSYLSKIEKNNVIARPHIQEALLHRLKLDTRSIKISQEANFLDELYAEYKNCVLVNNSEQAQKIWSHFNNFTIEFSSRENFYKCNLYLQRIAIIAEQPVLEIDEISKAFLAIVDHLHPRELFLYYVNCCHYCYAKHLYDDAVIYIKQAQKWLDDPTIEKWMIGDYHLLVSSVNHAIYQHSASVSQAFKALNIFESLNLHIPIINCYLRIGISNNRNGFFEYAKTNFDTAYRFALQYELVGFYGRILQNLGYNAALMGDSKLAITYYKKSLYYKNTLTPKLVSIHSIAKEYSKTDAITHIRAWCSKGKKLIADSAKPTSNRKYFYHFSILEMYHAITAFDDELILEAIDYFQGISDLLNVQKYSLILAKFYFKMDYFEMSALYFELSSETALTVQERMNWQDLS